MNGWDWFILFVAGMLGGLVVLFITAFTGCVSVYIEHNTFVDANDNNITIEVQYDAGVQNMGSSVNRGSE